MSDQGRLQAKLDESQKRRYREVFPAFHVAPLGKRRSKVRIGGCQVDVEAQRSDEFKKRQRVTVVQSSAGGGATILDGPPGLEGPIIQGQPVRVKGQGFTAEPPTITLSVVVNNNICGTLTPDDFVILFDGVPLTREVLTVTVPGPHVLTPEINPNNDYTFVWSGGCDAGGNITLVAGQDAVCTITFSDRPFAITDFFACDFLGGSGAPGDDFRNVTRDRTHAAIVHGPCISGAYTATVVLPVSGVSFTPNGNIASSEEPDRCAGCDPTLGAGFRMGDGLVVDISVPLSTVIRIRLSGPEGTAEADAYTVIGTGNPNNTGLGPCF